MNGCRRASLLAAGALTRFLAASFLLMQVATADDPPASVSPPPPTTDARAAEVADEVMRALGGRDAWDRTRYVRWYFFGRRLHYWDKWTGDVRIDAGDKLVLMNINTRKGRAWDAGVEVTQPDSLAKRLKAGFAWWTNDSYWVFMPYKLQDAGVRLKYLGERAMHDGRAADVLELTFGNVGLTPENKYEVLVDKETCLVGEWCFYKSASDAAPVFTLPWKGWQRVGNIMLAGDHGRDEPDWKLAVYDDLPRTVFTSPELVAQE